MSYPKKADHQIYDYWDITKPEKIFPDSINDYKKRLKHQLDWNIKFPDDQRWDYDYDVLEENKIFHLDPMSEEYQQILKLAKTIITEDKIDHLLEAYKRYVDGFMEKQLFYPIESKFYEFQTLITDKIWNDDSMYLEDLSQKQFDNLIKKFEDFVFEFEIYAKHLIKHKENIGGNWRRTERILESFKELDQESDQYFDGLVDIAYDITKSKDKIGKLYLKHLKGFKKI